MFTRKINKRKTGAILMGLTLSLTGSVFAAPQTATTDLDSRIAALEQEQQKLADELATLKHQNSQLKNQVKSQKSLLKGLNKNLNEHKDRIQFTGFGRVSWDNDNVQGYIDRNDGRRTYLDLHAKFHVNDKWNFNFQSETNERYANLSQADGVHKYHDGHDGETDGTIQRVWAEGSIGKLNVDVGRRWRGLGMQNVLFGNESDGVVLSTDIPKSKLRASTFYLTPTDKGYDFSIYGGGVQGQVGHGLQINCAFAKLNLGRNDFMGKNYYDPTVTAYIGDRDAQQPATITASGVTLDNGQFKSGYIGLQGGTEYYAEANGENTAALRKAIAAGFDGVKEGYNLNITNSDLSTSNAYMNGVMTTSTTYADYRNTAGRYGFVLSAMWNPLKNIFFIGDYVKTDNPGYTITQYGENGRQDSKFNDNVCKMIRLNYRWSNIDNPGSFQLYARWFDYARNYNNLVGIFGDKEWSAFQPGSKGWAVGFKFVPMKNLEWETFYEGATAFDTRYGLLDHKYHRNFVRTMVDYHF